jgi:(1->4)-alpha-D-glucan 1-alpha-D-glucosylmutase
MRTPSTSSIKRCSEHGPSPRERVTAYMEKAVREAKTHTSWTQQNKEFEDALRSFIERILDSAPFLSELEAFVAQIVLPGRINSLTQTLIKCTAPGVPDTYQGSELWDLRLVDPDNRGPVDYEVRQSMLAELKAMGLAAEEIMKRMDSGHAEAVAALPGASSAQASSRSALTATLRIRRSLLMVRSKII